MSIQVVSGLTRALTPAPGIPNVPGITILGEYPSTPAGADDGLLTELSEQLITEAGDFLIWEA